MENRAAVFTDQPQAIEVYQAGTWWAGELLGWRHDANGSCQVWVRVVLGGVAETAWTDLASLRLPERHLAVAAEPSERPARRAATQEMSVARHPAGRRSRASDDDEVTAGLPMVRDLTVVPDLPSRGGRRTADETAQFASIGRRRAPEAPVVSSGGRRRAPDDVPAAPATSGASGRHRAPSVPGRHRTADTGLGPVPVVSDLPARVPAAAGSRAPRAAAGWTATERPDAELLTRPLRLGDQQAHGRRPRLDGSLRPV